MTESRVITEIDNEDMEIDLLELFFVLLDKWKRIAFFTILGGALFFSYSKFMIAPTYQSTASLYIVSASSDSVVNLTDLNIGTTLTKDYEELILSYPVLEKVINELRLETTTEELAKQISISNPNNTRILNITTTTTDPEMSKDISNKVVEVAIEYLPDTMNTNPPNIAQNARLPLKKAGPSNVKNGIIGALLGMGVTCAWIIMNFLLDDSIQSNEDMEKIFGLVPLTTIPEDSSLSDAKGAGKKKKKKRKRRRLLQLFSRRGR